MIITNHAIDRFRERVRDVPPELARNEITQCLMGAKPKHLRKFDNTKKRTAIIPTGCCYFILSFGKVVSVVKELRDEA